MLTLFLCCAFELLLFRSKLATENSERALAEQAAFQNLSVVFLIPS